MEALAGGNWQTPRQSSTRPHPPILWPEPLAPFVQVPRPRPRQTRLPCPFPTLASSQPETERDVGVGTLAGWVVSFRSLGERRLRCCESREWGESMCDVVGWLEQIGWSRYLHTSYVLFWSPINQSISHLSQFLSLALAQACLHSHSGEESPRAHNGTRNDRCCGACLPVFAHG